jgi:hypothetical protein
MLGNIGNFFSGPAGQGLSKIASLGATGAGLFSNIAANRQQSQEANLLMKQQQDIANTTPAQLTAEATQAAGPLNAGLVQSVTNATQGNLAEQGLAESPGIQSAVLAQALAPYQQQNVDRAMQAILAKLGLPAQYAGAIMNSMPRSQSLAPLLALFARNNSGGSGSSNLPDSFGPGDLYNMIYGGGGVNSNDGSVGTGFGDYAPSGGGF